MALNRREKQKRKQRFLDAKARLEELLGQKSTYGGLFKTLSELKSLGFTEVGLYVRTSSRSYWHRKVASQTVGLQALVKESGFNIAKPDDGSLFIVAGWETGRADNVNERELLQEAIETSRILGVPLVAVCVSRFLRSSNFHAIVCNDAVPTNKEVRRLKRWLDGVTLAVVFPPNTTSLRDEEDALRIIGSETSNHWGGRSRTERVVGTSEEKRNRWLENVLEMRKNGATLGEIARNTGIKKSTIQKWLDRKRTIMV